MPAKLIITLLLCFFTATSTHAAFPVINKPITIDGNATTIQAPGSLHNRVTLPEEMPRYIRNGKTKSHGLAIVLALFLGGAGVHRFYLGYGWQGALQLVKYGFLGAGIAVLQATESFTEIAAITTASIFFAAYLALSIWRWVDFARITNESLTPKNGTYR